VWNPLSKLKMVARTVAAIGTELVPGIEVVRAVREGRGVMGIASAVAMEAVFLLPGVGVAGRLAKVALKGRKIARVARGAQKGRRMKFAGRALKRGKKGRKQPRRATRTARGGKGVKKPRGGSRFGGAAQMAGGAGAMLPMGGGGMAAGAEYGQGAGGFRQPRGRVSKRYTITDTMTGETKPYVSKPRRRAPRRRAAARGPSNAAIMQALIAKGG